MGCNTNKKETYNTQSIEVARSAGDIGSFNLLTPAPGFIGSKNITFTWEEAKNADYYQLEIANTNTFFNDPDPKYVYVKENNLSQPKFELTYSLPRKNENYFWKVTALNLDHKVVSNDIGTFYYKASNEGEVSIEIDDPDDWVVHKEGSQAEVSVDRNNFFGNGKNSLVIKFDKEHTQQGIVKSDSWIVITRSADVELYNLDAFYLNFFYSGQDANVLIRVLDNDGEYWHQQVRIANNAKQTVILKRSGFTLRTAGTNVNNRVFDWEHIRYFEVVFEKAYGDGVCIISDVRAVNVANYQDMFMQEMNFKRDDIDSWTNESYNFGKSVSEDGKELTISYSPSTGFGGWGLQHVFLYKYLADGDALRLNFKYTGSSQEATFYFRILEEDRDIWQYKMPFTYFTESEYKTLTIPLKAFQRLEGGMNGDGAKQLTFIQKLMFGLSDNKKEGTISIKDLEVVSLDDLYRIDDEHDGRTLIVGADGCVEDFNDYDVYTDIYRYWDQSEGNKDEAIKLDTAHKTGGRSNPYCAEFDYKADMEQAIYQVYMDTTAVTADKKAFSIWLKDASMKSDNPVASAVDEEAVTAVMDIQLTMASGEWYRTTIKAVSKEWTRYVIPFASFELFNEKSLTDKPLPLTGNKIIHMAFGFAFKYPVPTYAIANPVYIDEIYFTDETEASTEFLPGTLRPDTADDSKITIDTFDDYTNDEDMLDNWSKALNSENHALALSTEQKSSQGGTKSLSLQFKGKTELEYVRKTPFSRSSTARGVAIDIKAPVGTVVYFYLNVLSGKKTIKMRATIVSNNEKWMHYEIGFDLFEDKAGTTISIAETDIKAIDNLSLSIFDSLHESPDDPSLLYVDNIRLLRTCDFDRNYKKQIDTD